ncbi:hypothetical protein [Pseudofrankia sp. BMG5.36]|uniref:hypothetical protein n=1 Tax=Pseudofrankia sp. BMG5.36 TaxID=1834512 RepID=UPI0008D919C1|nr:hypothetical protein [Pseudofrankia sp. BMG5.36]OHV59558.1 hypothetical protein BCD48_41175 [Pseudofrankia sp. BMG5.36]
MRIGLMIGSDKDRQYSERVAGFIADAQAVIDTVFSGPSELDSMTIIVFSARSPSVTADVRPRLAGTNSGLGTS